MIAVQPSWRAIGDLTERQRDILQGICQGKRNAEIADALGISGQTVKNHVTTILARTGSTDRARLAYLYARWEQVQRSRTQGSQVEEAINDHVTLSFRIFSPNKLLIRVGRLDGLNDLFELSVQGSRELRRLLLADIDDDSCGAEQTVVSGQAGVMS